MTSHLDIHSRNGLFSRDRKSFFSFSRLVIMVGLFVRSREIDAFLINMKKIILTRKRAREKMTPPDFNFLLIVDRERTKTSFEMNNYLFIVSFVFVLLLIEIDRKRKRCFYHLLPVMTFFSQWVWTQLRRKRRSRSNSDYYSFLLHRPCLFPSFHTIVCDIHLIKCENAQ